MIRNATVAGHNRLRLNTRKLFLIIRADRSLKILIVIIILGSLLMGLSGHFIQPYKTTQTYTEQMYSYRIEHNGLNYPNQKLNLYALAPNYPIYITVDDSQHTLLSYQVYFINDTNNAIGIGPATLIEQGQISDTTTFVIPHTIYHMTYRLELESPGLPAFTNTVTYEQTTFLYPSSNYYLLIPGILMAVAAILMFGGKIISISSDRERYLSQLKFKDPKDASIVLDQGTRNGNTDFRFPWFANVLLGILLCSGGFTIFGRQYILTWIGIALIIAGVSFILNGIVRLLSKRF